jgi:predicted DNA-binding protein
MTNKKYHLGIRISKDTENAIRILAKKDHRKISDYCRILIEKHVKENNGSK